MAVKVAVLPLQMAGLFTVILGKALIDTVLMALLEQPFEFVPVTVYDVAVVKAGVVILAVTAPVDHK